MYYKYELIINIYTIYTLLYINIYTSLLLMYLKNYKIL